MIKHRDFNAVYDRLSQRGKNAFEMSVLAIELTEKMIDRVTIIDDNVQYADGKRRRA